MRASLSVSLLLLSFGVAIGGCGGGAGDPDAGGAGDSGGADAGEARDSGGGTDAGGGDDAGASDAGGGGGDAGGGADAGGGGGSDGGGGSGCPCFGAVEIAAIEAHAAAGGTRGCMVGVASGTFVTGGLSSTRGAQNVQVDVSEISGFAGVDWFCGRGCSDLNDDAIDDCAGAPLGPYEMTMVTEAQHDACEALIAAQCE